MEHREHRSVMVAEVLEALDPKPGEVFADLTLGMGGHARELLLRSGPDGTLLGFDADPEMLERARQTLSEWSSRIELHHLPFDRVADRFGVSGEDGGEGSFDGILLDLGVASNHLDLSDRGFSFVKDGPLDMRLDRSSGMTAAEIVNRRPFSELEQIFRDFGQERFARRVARVIVEVRARRKITRTLELADLVARVVRTPGRGRIHPATRVFQALRIAVNDELGRLERVLEACPRLLRVGGRVAVISFHSLEDGRVKRSFREEARNGRYRLLTKKPLRPGLEEVDLNPRARSARLRAAVRIDS